MPLAFGAVPPKKAPDAPGKVEGLRCVEPGCEAGELRLRWSHRTEMFFYGCSNHPRCDGTLPANPNGSPRGAPRTKEVQSWRDKAHKTFDPIWREGHATRTQAYRWLQFVMRIDAEKAHHMLFGIAECQLVIQLVKLKGPGTPHWETWVAAGRPGWPIPPQKRTRKKKVKRRW